MEFQLQKGPLNDWEVQRVADFLMVINDFNGTTNAPDRAVWKLHSKGAIGREILANCRLGTALESNLESQSPLKSFLFHVVSLQESLFDS